MSVRSYQPTGGLGRAAASGRKKTASEPKKVGFLGSGIGPDMGLGLTRTFQEVGQGLSGLVRMALPGSKEGEPGLEELLKGGYSSVLGTAKSFPGGEGLNQILDATGLAPDDLFGEEYRPQHFNERAAERGILPALVEDVGNVSLVAGGVTAPVRAGAAVANKAGATGTAARLSAAHKSLLANPAVSTLQHPYRTTGAAVREGFMKPAAATKLRASGGDSDFQVSSSGDVTPAGPAPEAPGPVGRVLAKGEEVLQGREAVRFARDQIRLVEKTRREAMRSPAIVAAVTAARDHVLDLGRAAGLELTRADADRIVGSEMDLRLTGNKALLDQAVEKGIPEAEARKAAFSGYEAIPEELRTKELDALIDEAVEAQRTVNTAVRETLLSSRRGPEGLEGAADPAAMDADLTKTQRKRLAAAYARLEKAESMQGTIGRERHSTVSKLIEAQERLSKADSLLGKIDEQNTKAAADFDTSRKTGRLKASGARSFDDVFPMSADKRSTDMMMKRVPFTKGVDYDAISRYTDGSNFDSANGIIAAMEQAVRTQVGSDEFQRNLRAFFKERGFAENDYVKVYRGGGGSAATDPSLGEFTNVTLIPDRAKAYGPVSTYSVKVGDIVGQGDNLVGEVFVRRTGLRPITDVPVPEESGTRPQIAVRPSKLGKTATKADMYHSGRRGAESLARIERLGARRRTVEVAKKKIEKSIDELTEILDTGSTKAELDQRKLVQGADRTIAKVADELQQPSTSMAPVRWRPLYKAAQDLAKMADTYPEMASLLEDLPATLGEVQKLALENGFNPEHVAQMTPRQVRRLVYGNLRLGLKDNAVTETVSGRRKKRTGALEAAGGVDRSISAFIAASVDATLEARTNAVIDHVESSVARSLGEGQPVPDGWVPWSPTRTFLLTGQEVSEATGKTIETAPQQTLIVPKTVVNMLKREASDPGHWAFDTISKITDPWRALVLTLSMGWYVRNFAGNVIMATVEGARPQDWVKAWKSYRTQDRVGDFADIPFVTSHTLAQEAGRLAEDSVVPLAKGRQGLREMQLEGGKIRGAKDFAQKRLLRVNQVVDEIARAAVYHNGRRFNMTPEAAWKRASEALVDYGNLSPFERRAVRSVIPFYSWQKGILRVTMKQAIDHPARAGVLAQLGQMQEDYVSDLLGIGEGGQVPSYYAHLVGDRNLRGYNPFADPSEILSPEGITRSMNPFLEVFIRKGLGAPEFFPDSHRMGAFGSAEADVDVTGELGRMVTSSPAGRIIQGTDPASLVGLQNQDLDKLRERIARAQKTLDSD